MDNRASLVLGESYGCQKLYHQISKGHGFHIGIFNSQKLSFRVDLQ